MIRSALLLALALPTAAVAQQSGMPLQPPPQIVTSGLGEARVTPDRAWLNLGVETRGRTAAEASAENARKSRAIIDAVKRLGIPAELIQTSGYNVWPEYDQRPQPRGEAPGTPRIVGYRTSNMVRVEVRKTDQVGSVIDATLAAGANQVHGINFFASNVDDARRTALAEAIQKARADADVMARAAGGQLGQLLELSTGVSRMPPIPYRAGNVLEMAQRADVPTPVEPGEQTLNVMVTARWAFVQQPR